MDLDRRDLLRWLGAAGGGAAAAALGACGGSSGGGGGDARDPDGGAGPDAAPGPDADPACRPTTGDAQGPFFEDGAPMRAAIAGEAEPGTRLTIDVEVLAEGCATAAAGVLVDIWQADRDGAYHGAGKDYRLRGQVVAPADGRFTLETIRPGNYALGVDAWRPAHIHFMFAHPDYAPVTTQLYFAGDPYLPPNDGCTTCGSDDPDRIIALVDDGAGGLRGEVRFVLRPR
jgi:catechol 1,2-dioxygenase